MGGHVEAQSRLHLVRGLRELEEAHFMCYTYYTYIKNLSVAGDEARRKNALTG